MVLQQGWELLHRLKPHRKKFKRACPFADLPAELLQAIIPLLDTPDLCSLRLTCTRIYQNTTKHFGSKFLHTIGTDLSLESLQKVQTVSQNPDLAPLVQKLVVEKRWPEEEERYDLLGHGISWRRHPAKDHIVIPQEGFQLWKDAIQSLVNCKSFELDRHASCDDYFEYALLTPSDALSLILNIIIHAKLSVVSFSVEFSNNGCPLDMTRIKADIHNPAFIAAWSTIQDLRLSYEIKTPISENWTMQLIRQATGLRKLSINLPSYADTHPVLAQLSTMPLRLESLCLETIEVSTPMMLENFLCRHSHTLHKLHLRYCHVDDWHSFLRHLSSGEFASLEDVSFWTLRSTHMERLNFAGVSKDPFIDESRDYKFDFYPRPRFYRGRQVVFCISYCGPSMGLALRKIAGWAEYM